MKNSIGAAVIYTISYIVIKILISLGLYELIAIFTDDIYFLLELSELLSTIITLGLLVWFLIKRNIFSEQKTLFDYSRVKLIAVLIIIVIGLRLVEDPIFRYKNILLKEPLLEPDSIEPFTLTMTKLISIINTVIFVPILEELFFRKLIFKKLSDNLSNLILPLIISSILFAASHLSLRNAIPTFAFGIISAFIYHKTNNISNSILLHIFSNLIWLTIIIDPYSYYWTALNYLSFNIFYWSIVVFGIILISMSIKKVSKITPID